MLPTTSRVRGRGLPATGCRAEIELRPRGPVYPMSAILAASISPLTSPDFGDYAFKPLIDDEPLASVSLSIRPLLQLHAGSGARLAVGPAGTA